MEFLSLFHVLALLGAVLGEYCNTVFVAISRARAAWGSLWGAL